MDVHFESAYTPMRLLLHQLSTRRA